MYRKKSLGHSPLVEHTEEFASYDFIPDRYQDGNTGPDGSLGGRGSTMMTHHSGRKVNTDLARNKDGNGNTGRNGHAELKGSMDQVHALRVKRIRSAGGHLQHTEHRGKHENPVNGSAEIQSTEIQSKNKRKKPPGKKIVSYYINEEITESVRRLASLINQSYSAVATRALLEHLEKHDISQ